MKERTQIKWENAAERTLAVAGFGTMTIVGPVLGPIVALARLRNVRATAARRGRPLTVSESVKFVTRPVYSTPVKAISAIVDTYKSGTKRLHDFDVKQARIKEREEEEAEVAARNEAKRQEIKKAESPENLEKSPVGAVIKCIREMRILGTRFEANATNVECKFNPKDEQIITNKYIFSYNMVLDKAKVERNFMTDRKLDKDAVVYEIPEILRNLVDREIKARLEKEQALLKQKEMDAQKQMFMDALKNEKQK